jgi:hypothetical protein
MRRIGGVHCASIYANEKTIYSTEKLPNHFETWKDYRNFLLDNAPIDAIERFRSRFARQLQTESVFRQQCKQLLLNDWENNLTIDQKVDKRKQKMRDKWFSIL